VGMLGSARHRRRARRQVRRVRDDEAGGVGAEPDRDREPALGQCADGLTGCFTRAHAMKVLKGDLRRAGRTDFPVSDDRSRRLQVDQRSLTTVPIIASDRWPRLNAASMRR